MRRSPSIDALRRQRDDFNSRHAVGTSVRVKKDNGDIVDTTTRSAAELLQEHSVVIWLEGIAGCYLLDRVTPVIGGAA